MHPNIQKSAPKDQYLCDFMIWYLLWFNWFNYNAFFTKTQRLYGLSKPQLEFLRNASEGHGIIKMGNSMIPFSNLEPKDTAVYKLITTKPGEATAEKWFCIKKRRAEARLRISGSLVLSDIVFQITQTRFVVVNKRLRVFCIRKADNIAVLGLVCVFDLLFISIFS